MCCFLSCFYGTSKAVVGMSDVILVISELPLNPRAHRAQRTEDRATLYVPCIRDTVRLRAIGIAHSRINPSHLGRPAGE
jgi:hypothetical protein